MPVTALDDPLLEDLTARARIREAALHLFAEKGVEGATIRDIAAEAGVSGGLVRHHFGSKDDLRAACDAYALSRLMRIKELAVLEGRIASPGFMSSAQPSMLFLFRYLARSMVDGSPAADAMFDEMVGLCEEWLAEHHRGQMRDRRAYSALLIAMELGVLTLRRQLSRQLGADIFEPEGHLRLARAKVDFYSQPLLDPELAAQAHATLGRLRRTPSAARPKRSRPAKARS
jgi:TetR/AcrR family transcriptional regulator, regulator of cefoperazone and chloramphenicol sensitivity